MQPTEVLLAFTFHAEKQPIPDDFQSYWSGLWKPITQQCLNIAKHTFVMQKAFEFFKNKVTTTETPFQGVFMEVEEEKVLKSLCEHVKLQKEEFMDYGLHHHRNRCRKYYSLL